MSKFAFIKVFSGILFVAGLYGPLILPARVNAANIVVAYVNTDSITTDMMLKELSHMHSMQMETVNRNDFSIDRLLQKLINNRLIVQEAKAIGLDQDSSVVDEINSFREKIVYKALQTELFPDTFTATNEEMQIEFNEMYQRFDLRILCVNDSLLSARIADSIRADESWDRLARAYSIDKAKDNGGNWGEHALFDLPVDQRKRLVEAKDGELVGPVFMWRVYALLSTIKREPADPAIFDSVKSILVQSVQEKKRGEARGKFLDTLRTQISVVIDSAGVDSVIHDMLLGRPGSQKSVVTVASTRILTAQELRNKYMHRISGKSNREAHVVLYEVLATQIEAMLLKEYAILSQYANQSRFEDETRVIQDSLLINLYLQDVIAPKVKVTKQDISDFYEQNKDNYRTPRKMHIATLSRSTEEEARQDYEALVKGTEFSWLAKRNSIDEARDKGGDMGWFASNTLPEKEVVALDTLPLMGITQPMKSELGYVIVQLLDRQEGEIIPFDQVKDQVHAVVEQHKEVDAIDKTIKELRASANIRIQDDALKSLQIGGHIENNSTQSVTDGQNGNAK